MSATAAAHAEHAAHGGHGHGHNPHLAHHFESMDQQVDSNKLGMWLFLSTEILLFGGLFCAYAVYRSNHPEIFMFAHQFLDTKWGAINTVVLLFSSFTMAWAVRAAQQANNKLCAALLALTFLCGCGFMGIKYYEYTHKFHYGIGPGRFYKPDFSAAHASKTGAAPAAAHAAEPKADMQNAVAGAVAPSADGVTQAAAPAAPAKPAPPAPVIVQGVTLEHTAIPAPAKAPSGLAFSPALAERSAVEADPNAAHTTSHAATAGPEPRHTKIFFSIYFCMTGLHGIHVVIGMIVIAWLFFRSLAGHWTPQYNTPVDLGGLYWHLVDLIWIYLFPLLYLIH